MPKSQPGTGSAENREGEHSEQQNRAKDLSQGEKQDIARQIGEKPGKIASQRDTGLLNGRDDSSGGSGDRREGENTGEETDRQEDE
ncbi:MAG TPA: hypothetical protein VGE66_12945 [Chitinophagaceae bacterium]